MTNRRFVIGYDNTNIEADEEEAQRRIYKKYAPAKSVIFNYDSSEGYIARVFRCKDNFGTLRNLWTMSIPASLAGGIYLHQMVSLGAFYFYLPHLVVAPIVMKMLNQAILSRSGTKYVREIYLLKNGDQILLQTIDDIWHKICIQDISSYKMVDKKKYMLIHLKYNGRVFTLSTKNRDFINFEILDKIMKGVCIQTSKTKTRARPPANLKNEATVGVDTQKLLKLPRAKVPTTKKTLKVDPNEDYIKEQFKQLGLHNYSENTFYKTHKISRIDFINKIKDLPAEQQNEEILKLYEDKSTKGRRINLSVIEQNLHKAIDLRTANPQAKAKVRSI